MPQTLKRMNGWTHSSHYRWSSQKQHQQITSRWLLPISSPSILYPMWQDPSSTAPRIINCWQKPQPQVRGSTSQLAKPALCNTEGTHPVHPQTSSDGDEGLGQLARCHLSSVPRPALYRQQGSSQELASPGCPQPVSRVGLCQLPEGLWYRQVP